MHHSATALQHISTRCNTPHHTATHCNTLQRTNAIECHEVFGYCAASTHCNYTATHCSTLQDTATNCNAPTLSNATRSSDIAPLQHTATALQLHCNCTATALQRTNFIRCREKRSAGVSLLQHPATAMQHTASTLQHTATHRNTLQHTATHCTCAASTLQLR